MLLVNDPTDGILSEEFAVLSSLVNADGAPPNLRVRALLDAGYAPGEFSVRSQTVEGAPELLLEGASRNALLCALYSWFEHLGLCFELSGATASKRVEASDFLKPVDFRVKPVFPWRGIRQHINFPMDLSGYSLLEAKKYIANVARLRFNHITFHSYPGQWYEAPVVQPPNAGKFFYGVTYRPGEDPFLREHVRNEKFFCIPEIEPFYEDPGVRSAMAMDWLRNVMREALRFGIRIQFSFEPLGAGVENGIRIAERILELYPEIEIFEVITNETSEHGEARTQEENLRGLRETLGEEIAGLHAVAKYLGPGQRGLHRFTKDLGEVVALSDALSKKWRKEEGRPAVCCGVYCTVPGYLQMSVEVMRRVLAAEVMWAFLPAHGSSRVAETTRQLRLTREELAKTTIYSWLEFDGLMYVQQNAVSGIHDLAEDLLLWSDGSPLPTLAFNHWRTNENIVSARYASESSLFGPQHPTDFYDGFASRHGIQPRDAFASALTHINRASERASYELPNIGFCAGWHGTSIGMIAWQSPQLIENVLNLYRSAQLCLQTCREETSLPSDVAILKNFANRIQCSMYYLEAILDATELQPIMEGRTPEVLSVEERRATAAILERALEKLNLCVVLYAEILPDRGAEGQLTSLCSQTLAFLKGLKSAWTNASPAEAGRALEQDTEVEGPPLPIQTAFS